MGDKYWWEKDDQQKDSKSNVKGTAKDNGGQGYWWESGSIANMVGSNISNRVNNWLNNHNTYISDYQKRNSGRKYTYEDAYVSDSASWLDTVSQRKSASDAEADSILSYMDQYKDYLDADWMKSVRNTLTGARDAQSQLLDITTKDHEWWNSFGQEELVKKHGSAEDAYKYYQRSDGYSKKYAGMTSDELIGLAEKMDKGEEKDWLNSYAASVDYDEKLSLDLNKAQEEIEEMEDFYDRAFTVEAWHTAYQMNPDAWEAEDVERNMPLYNELKEKYGSAQELDKLINRKKVYLNNAKKVQKSAAEAEYWNSYTQAPDYEQYAAKGAAIENPSFRDAQGWAYLAGWRPGAEDVGNIVTFSRDNYNDIMYASEGGRYPTVGNPLYKNMTEDEVKLYNFLLSKEGKEAADSYLSYLEPSLKAKEGKRMADAVTGIDIPVLEDLMVVSYGLAGGVDQFVRGTKSYITGEESTPSIIQHTNENISESLDGIGYYAHQAAITVGNMAPSILLSSVTGGLGAPAGVASAIGSASLGVSAAGNAYSDALSKGYDKGAARTYGDLVGVSEATLQYLLGGIGKLGGASSKFASKIAAIDSGLLRAAARLGVSTGLEVLEEELQLYLEPLFATIVFDADYDAPTIEEMVETAIVTFMSTGALEGRSTISRTKAEQATKKQYGDYTKELIDEGLASDINSESYKLAKEYKAKIDGKKSLTGAEILQLVEANEKQFAVEDHEEAVTVAKERLKELGETGNINKIAEAVAKRATGEELTAEEKKLLVNSYGSKVAKEMTIGENETKFTPIENRIGKEGKFDVSEDGQTKIKSSGEALDLSNIEITNVKKGEVTIKLEDGREVSADDIAFANDSQSYLVTAVSNIEHVTPSAATAIVRDIVDPSKPLGEQMNGIDEAYTYGYHGYSVADLKAGNFTTSLTNEQMMSAYQLGKAARNSNIEAKDAPRVRMRTALQEKLTSKEKTAQQKARFESKEAEVYFLDGENTTKVDGTVELDDKRMAAVNYAKLLSKMKIGSKYYFYKSYENADGVRVYKDANGNEVEAPNGIYKASDGSIYIDLNAGDKGQGTALFTLGHELTHFIKAWSEKKFKVLADFLIEEYGKTDVSMRQRVVEKQTFLEEKRGEKVSYDEAFEEVVADAMSTMLTDGNLHEKLAKLKTKDRSLFNKIKQFFNNMIAKFQAAYKDLTPEQQAARDVRAMKDGFDRIQQAFAEALVEASENYHAAMESVVESNAKPLSTNEIITDGAVVTDGNGEKHSIRSMKHDIAEGKMFEDLKNVCGWTDAQVETLRTQLSDLVEYMIPYRNILDMNESYGREGRRFSPYKPNSDPLYKISMDFSTLCSKRLLTQYVIENLQLRENRPMSAEEQMAIRDMLNEYRKVEKGLQVACAMCYVEAARLKSPKQIQRWLDDPTPHLTNYFAQKNTEFNDSVKKAQADFKESKGYDRNAPKKDMKPADVKELNKIGPRLRAKYQPSAEEQAIIDKAKTLPNSTYLTAGNLASLSETDPALYAAYTSFVRTATRSKSLETDEPYYYGDSTRDNGNGIIVSDSFIESVNRENGMRFSSWSDWRIHHMLDYITAVIDNSVRGAAMHGYTKFGDEVRVLGKTGMMFNMSGVAGTQTGLNEDGSLNFSDTESINVNEAIQLREEFPETAGLQCIGVSPEHITALLRSDIIDYVIPYHVSGLNAALRRMADIHGWKDFTGTQHATIDKSIKFEDSVDKEHWHEEPVFSEFFVGYDTGMSGIEAMKASAEKYKQMCKDRGLTPKFEQFASEDNYWKLLIDRKMINQQTGNLIRQKAVTPTFDFNVIKGVVDKFVDNYDAGMEQRALNHIVENWDSIPQRIKDLKKQGGTKAKKANKAVNTLANQTVAALNSLDHLKFSERVSNKELAKMDDTALYINNTDKANYIGMIFSGAKTEETRSQRTLDAFIGNDFYVTDGKYVYGSIVLGEPHKYTAEAFHQKENQLKHRVPVGDKYDVNPGGTKWAYPIESYKKFAQPKKLSDSTEYKHSFQARQILYADKANLSKIEYDRLAKKKPIQVSKQELAMIRSQRKTKYGNLGEYDIPVIDFFRIGDYRIINNGFIYYIRNSGLDDFSVVMRKQIVPDVRRITREVIEDENRRNDAPTNPGTSQERGERRSDRSSGKRTRNGRELLENDGGTRQSGESQRILHSRKGDADSGALMSDRNLPSMEGYDGKTPTKRQLFDDISEIYFRMNALDRDLRKATKDGYAEGISRINGEIADVKERYIEYGEYLLENYEKYSLSDIRSLSRPLGLTEAFSDSSSYTVEQFRKDLAARVKEYRKDTKDAWSKQVKTMSREDKTLHTALKFMAYQAGYDVSGFDGVTEETEASHEDDWLLDSETPFSERGDGSSNRALLANAFEGITQNSDEYKMIQEYKNRIKLLNEQEEKLDKLNAEIRKIRFGTTGARDTARLAQLEAEAKNVAKAINRHDKKLLSLEASEPLRKVIERERKKEAQKTKDHVREVQQHKKLRAEQTELRHKIRKTIRDLDKILNRGNKKQNVKEDMKGFVSKALELADYIFTDHVSNEDLIRNGITVRMRAGEAALVKETEEILYQLYDNADNLTDEEFARLDAKRQSNMEKLRDLLKEQRNERLNTPVYDLFDAVVTEYAKLKNSSQDAVRAAYNVDLERMLRQFIGDSADGTDTDRKTLLQNMRVADMTTDELQKLLDAYKMVLTNVRDANKVFAKSSSASIEEIANNITKDFSQRKAPSGKVAIVAKNIANKIGWDYEKLYYALDRIGSEAFTELVMNIANSENTVMQDIKESVAFRDEMVEKYGFNNWDVNKEIDREFLDNTGKKFKLTLGQVMALYAYSRRKGAWDHIEYGGFVFGEAALTNPKPADSYKLSKSQCEAITDLLTKEQKAYAEDMQKYLSDTMGAKGNEVSMMLYGIKMFGEKNYFPIKIAGQFKAQANESQAKAAAGFSSMTNAGFTHEQNPNAKAPFVLEGFNEIWSDHVNEMSRYHGTVPALEDMRRVMNRSSYSDSGTESMAIKQLMENSFGKEAVDYFDSLYREANSGAIQDKLQRVPKKLLSMFRKNSVAYSLSVVIQQPSAMTRAYAMIDPKYFGFKGVGALTSGIAKAVTSKWNPAYVNTYNKMLKYAPGVTMAKEIGGFDTHTGTSIREYLLDTNKSFKQKWKTGTLVEKGKAVMDIVDDNAIANLPNVADKIAWMEIWNACERETVAKHKELVPNSEEFLQFVGDRFTEVIRATQVYDSIFSKSPMLKSKNLAVQYIVSFMNEPNTTSNMVEKAVRDAIKGDWKGGVRTAAAVTCSIIFNNVLKSIVYAMRDDDEDETYIEKYIAAMTGGMIDDLNALNYVPLVRDVVSKLRGYDVERPDMAIITDAIDAFKAKAKLDGKDTDGMTEEEIAELDKQIAEANWDLVGSIASFFGIPAKNIIREIEGVIDHARIASANAGMTTAGSLLDKVKEEIIDSIPFLSSNETKTDKLYNAIISGDTAYLDRIKGGYKTEAAYKSAVRKALKENDPRIKEAAQARYDGRTEEYKMIFREIQKDGKFKFNDIMSAVNSAENDIKNGTEPETEKSYYSSSDFVEAIVLGDTKSAQAIKDDIIATKIANGKSQETAEKEFISSVTSSIGDAYSSGLLDKARAEKMLVEYADKDSAEAASKVSYWEFCEEHPQYDLSESNVNDYREFAEPAKISLDVFVQYINGTKGLKTKYDDWGDVEVSERDQVLEVIDSLPLTWQQKDALYLATEYAESKIWDVPW